MMFGMPEGFGSISGTNKSLRVCIWTSQLFSVWICTKTNQNITLLQNWTEGVTYIKLLEQIALHASSCFNFSTRAFVLAYKWSPDQCGNGLQSALQIIAFIVYELQKKCWKLNSECTKFSPHSTQARSRLENLVFVGAVDNQHLDNLQFKESCSQVQITLLLILEAP